jgi:beta-barrel assembly-enhancing protease
MRLQQVGLLAIVAGTLSLSTGCPALKKVLGSTMDSVKDKAVDSAKAKAQERAASTATALKNAEPFEAINAEQEHYLGRAVGANILSAYPAADAEQANDYLNTLGQTLAMASERPDTYGGYRFALTASAEPHAFAAPGGFIFISKGMFELAGSEAGLAAVLAHEIAHVQHRHAVKAIKGSRITGALIKPGSESLSDQERTEIQDSFLGSIGDIINSVVTAGYSKKKEHEADLSSISTLKSVGYDPGALAQILGELEKREAAQATVDDEKKNKFLANHPPASERITRLTEAGFGASAAASSEASQARYDAALAALTDSVE